MPNKPPTSPCGSFSAIHAGCGIGVNPDEQTPGLGNGNAAAKAGQLLIQQGGVIYSRPISDYQQDTPPGPPPPSPETPKGPAYFPPGPPFGF